MRSQPEAQMIADRHGLPAFVLPVAFRDFAATVGSIMTAQAS
jgi:hypothetical protein